ncbi:MAG: efflux RND transporter periplasmic adaptor subunit [Cryomorphaceae bacterium]|nr:efflux RND transporter periplasmic adaptor subunit [Cryomorphaceae bacterium]
MKAHTLIKSAIFITLLILSACRSSNSDGEQKGQGAALEVRYMIVEGQPFSKSLTLNGTLLPNEEITMKSEVNGRVVRLLFEEGDFVKRGQLLVQLDDRDLVAELEKTKVLYNQAKIDVNRREGLLKSKAISEEEFDTFANREKELKAEINQLAARIDQYRINAPFDGVVGLRNISSGTMISTGESIASLTMPHPLKLEFSVPEQYAQLVKRNDTIHFTLRDNSDTLSATVFATDGRISPTTRSLRVRALYNNKTEKLIPGAYAKVIYPLEVYDEAILIPTDAVISSSDGQRVIKIHRGKAQPTLVETGERTSDDVQITRGLSSGDTIALTGLLYLRKDMPVTLQEKP